MNIKLCKCIHPIVFHGWLEHWYDDILECSFPKGDCRCHICSLFAIVVYFAGRAAESCSWLCIHSLSTAKAESTGLTGKTQTAKGGKKHYFLMNVRTHLGRIIQYIQSLHSAKFCVINVFLALLTRFY